MGTRRIYRQETGEERLSNFIASLGILGSKLASKQGLERRWLKELYSSKQVTEKLT